MKSLVFALAFCVSVNAFANSKSKLSIICAETAHEAKLLEIPTADQREEASISAFEQSAKFDQDLVLSTWNKDSGFVGDENDCALLQNESTSSTNVYKCYQLTNSSYYKVGLPAVLPAKGQSFKSQVVSVIIEKVKDGWFSSHEEKTVSKGETSCRIQ